MRSQRLAFHSALAAALGKRMRPPEPDGRLTGRWRVRLIAKSGALRFKPMSGRVGPMGLYEGGLCLSIPLSQVPPLA